MEKRHLEKLLALGYSVSEALDLLDPAEEPKTEPKPEPLPEPKPEPLPEPKPQPEKTAPENESIEALKIQQDAMIEAIRKLTKAVQGSNILRAGTDNDPNVNRADEFIAQMITGVKKEEK